MISLARIRQIRERRVAMKTALIKTITHTMKALLLLPVLAAASLLSSCTTVVEDPTPTVTTSSHTRRTSTTTSAYDPLGPAASTTTETRTIEAR